MYRSIVRAAIMVVLCSLPAFASTPPDSLADIRRQIDILTQEIERLKLGETEGSAPAGWTGFGPAASKVYSLRKSGVSLAGYGEILYENYSSSRDNGARGTTVDRVDYLRNILYAGFRFSDRVVFNSEIEFEHGNTELGGEVALEFGYIDVLISPAINVRAGMVLAPMGLINEQHEPPTFFGTVRPGVERFIVPSTWSMNAVGVFGEVLPGVRYRAYVGEALSMAGYSAAEGIRDGRQNGARAIAENLGVTGRLEYTGFDGLTVGASLFSGASGQGQRDSVGKTIDAMTTVLTVHGEVAWRGLEVRALYAGVTVDEADRVGAYQRWSNGLAAAPAIGSSMAGWYLSAGYDIMPLILPGSEHALAPYVFYETYDTQRRVPAGVTRDPENDRSTTAVGVSWKPHPNVAIKFDVRNNANAAGTATDQWNVAVTYLY